MYYGGFENSQWNQQHLEELLILQKNNIDIPQSPKTAKPRNEKEVCVQILHWSQAERPWKRN